MSPIKRQESSGHRGRPAPIKRVLHRLNDTDGSGGEGPGGRGGVPGEGREGGWVDGRPERDVIVGPSTVDKPPVDCQFPTRCVLFSLQLLLVLLERLSGLDLLKFCCFFRYLASSTHKVGKLTQTNYLRADILDSAQVITHAHCALRSIDRYPS